MTAKNLLIVDDEEDIRDVVEASLETVAGWSVVGAASGAEGLIAARADPFDAVLLDVMMPGMDGPQTLERLRRDPDTKDLPVIFLTARVTGSERERFMQLGAQGLIEKPFDALTLAAEVCELLGWER